MNTDYDWVVANKTALDGHRPTRFDASKRVVERWKEMGRPAALRVSPDICHMLVEGHEGLSTAYRVNVICDEQLPPNSMVATQ